MTVSDLISSLRLQVGDIALPKQNLWVGDGSTTKFITTEKPVVSSGYNVYVYSSSAWNLQTENTDYTIDTSTGIITFTTAPASGSGSGATNYQNVRLDYEYVFFRDSEWLQILQTVIRRYKRKLFTIVLDKTTFDSVAYQTEYDMSSISSDVIDVIDFRYKPQSDTKNSWTDVRTTGTNWSYDENLNKIILDMPFSLSTYDLYVLYALAATVPTSTSDTVVLNTDFLPPVEKFCLAEYWMRFASYKLRDKDAFIKESSYFPPAEIMKQAMLLMQEAREELAKVKPRYPSKAIPVLQGGRKRG